MEIEQYRPVREPEGWYVVLYGSKGQPLTKAAGPIDHVAAIDEAHRLNGKLADNLILRTFAEALGAAVVIFAMFGAFLLGGKL